MAGSRRPRTKGLTGSVRWNLAERAGIEGDALDVRWRGGDVEEAAIAASHGLTGATHFSRVFRPAYGLSPAEYRATYFSRVDGWVGLEFEETSVNG